MLIYVIDLFYLLYVHILFLTVLKYINAQSLTLNVRVAVDLINKKLEYYFRSKKSELRLRSRVTQINPRPLSALFLIPRPSPALIDKMGAHRGQKRQQSNADEVIAKRSRTTNDNDDKESEITVEPQQVKKAATKGKSKKGKQTRCVM